MTHRTLRLVLTAIVTVLSLGTFAEAAGPKKVAHQRPKHSTSVASGHSRQRATKSSMKKSSMKRRRRSAGAAATAKHKATAKKPAKRKPTTKPR